MQKKVYVRERRVQCLGQSELMVVVVAAVDVVVVDTDTWLG